MTPVVKTVLALSSLCFAVAIGSVAAHHARADKHYYRLVHAGRNENHEIVVSEYHKLPASLRARPLVKSFYEEAREQVGDGVHFDIFPTTESSDLYALAIFSLGAFCIFLWVVPRTPEARKLYSKEKTAVPQNSPTEGQLAFIRRINNGIIPAGLTNASAAMMIKEYISRVGMETRRQRIDISPSELMTGSMSYREKMRIERERKRAQEQLARQKEQERRRLECEERREKKAADRLYEKRIAEEERLIKARGEQKDGITHKTRSAKAQAIHEFQSLVNEILADKQINPQEVRQLKAWLMANRQSPDDFAQMFKLMDESLVDGIIDAKETQAIYEGVIDCLITLRERR